MAHTYKILGAFLNYPEQELCEEAKALFGVMQDEDILPTAALKDLKPFIHYLSANDLMKLQETYVDLFDRSRSLSLHLFEHIHGDGRDRGQAMVDLLTLYEQKGLQLEAQELPDFLPLFLEFLSTQDPKEAAELLRETGHVLEALGNRLAKRKTPYSRVMSSLMAIAGAHSVSLIDIQTQDEDPKDLEALDRDWAEEPVTFGPGEEGCPVAQSMLAKMNQPETASNNKGEH